MHAAVCMQSPRNLCTGKPLNTPSAPHTTTPRPRCTGSFPPPRSRPRAMAQGSSRRVPAPTLPLTLALASGDPELGLLGLALVHPFFWGSVPIGSEALNPGKKAYVDRIWPFVCSSAESGSYDLRINPVAEDAPSLAGLGCGRVFVLGCVAEKDVLRDRCRLYYDLLSRSDSMGVVEIDETEDEDHVFYLNDPDGQHAKDLIRRLAAFFNRDKPPLI